MLSENSSVIQIRLTASTIIINIFTHWDLERKTFPYMSTLSHVPIQIL